MITIECSKCKTKFQAHEEKGKKSKKKTPTLCPDCIATAENSKIFRKAMLFPAWNN